MQIVLTTISGKEFWIDQESVKEKGLGPIGDDDGVYLKLRDSETYATISPYGVESLKVYKFGGQVTNALWVLITEEEFAMAVDPSV